MRKKTTARIVQRFGLIALPAIIVCGFVFTGCSDGSNGVSAQKVVAVTGVTLEGVAGFSLAVGQNKILDYTVQPEKATDKTVIWSSSDPNVAIASESIVYAVGVGEATITVTTRNGGKTATWAVRVTPSIAVTGVGLNKTVLFLVKGSNGVLTPAVLPANASNNKVTWESYNTAVATVTGGTVSGVGAGKTTITVTTADGNFVAECDVTVVKDAPAASGMEWINPGTFIMGSPYDEPQGNENETPHQVTLTEGFYMGKHPVTQKQWEEIMGYNDSEFPQAGRYDYWAEDYYDDLYLDRKSEFPVETITWYEAILFCNLLSIDEGFSPAYTMYMEFAPNADDWGTTDNWEDEPYNWSTDPEDWGELPLGRYSNPTRWNNIRVVAGSGGYRLPTEAQWEYACRAGTTTPFNTGNNITTATLDRFGNIIVDGNGKIVDGQANYWGAYPYNNGGRYDPDGVVLGQPIPVGMFPSNPWGLYDMHGNISEWVWDWYGSYTRPGTAADTDPAGPATGTYRIRRGGSYYDDGWQVRSAYRSHIEYPGYYHDTIGFRVVRPYSVPNAPSSKAAGVTRTARSKL